MLSSRKRLVLVLFGKKTVTTSTFRIENRVFGNKTCSREEKLVLVVVFEKQRERDRERQRETETDRQEERDLLS